MRRDIIARMEEQSISLRSINRSRAVKMISTGMFADAADSDHFSMLITDNVGKKYHEAIYTPSLEWRIANRTVCLVQRSPNHSVTLRFVVFLLYRDEKMGTGPKIERIL